MTLPEGYQMSEDWRWYCPWTRSSPSLATSIQANEDRNNPVLRLANGQQTPTVEPSGHCKESLLGYRWDPQGDVLSTDKSGRDGEQVCLPPVDPQHSSQDIKT